MAPKQNLNHNSVCRILPYPRPPNKAGRSPSRIMLNVAHINLFSKNEEIGNIADSSACGAAREGLRTSTYICARATLYALPRTVLSNSYNQDLRPRNRDILF